MCFEEAAFVFCKLQIGLSKASEQDPDMLEVVFHVGAIYQDIVQISKCKIYPLQNLVHQGLEVGRCLCQTEWAPFEFPLASFRSSHYKHRLGLAFRG